MSEILQFSRHGASKITPRIIDDLMHKLPLLKAEFIQIRAPKYPHLVDQLEFLADVVEDCAEKAYLDLPYHALAGAAFALIYAHQAHDLIPDSLPQFGLADDSAIVRAILIEHERDFQAYAIAQGFSWKKITTKA